MNTYISHASCLHSRLLRRAVGPRSSNHNSYLQARERPLRTAAAAGRLGRHGPRPAAGSGQVHPVGWAVVGMNCSECQREQEQTQSARPGFWFRGASAFMVHPQWQHHTPNSSKSGRHNSPAGRRAAHGGGARAAPGGKDPPTLQQHGQAVVRRRCVRARAGRVRRCCSNRFQRPEMHLWSECVWWRVVSDSVGSMHRAARGRAMDTSKRRAP